jgi:L-malate glycosyltransferase
MKLCFLGDIRSIHVHKFINYFSKEHETHLISLDYIGDERVQHGLDFFTSINTHVYLLKKSQLLLSPFLARRIIQKIKPDLVQAHFITNYGFLGAFSGVHPLVVSAIGDDILIHPFESKFYNALVTYALDNADFITCDGVNYTSKMKILGVSEKKMIMIYTGVDMDLFHPSKRIEYEGKNVFYPRGFDKIYDTDTLLKTMNIIHKKYPEVKFTLLGIGTEFDKFKNEVLKTDLHKLVKYLGYIPNNRVPEHMASSDVSITTSLSDGGIPVSTVEAMACGVPVVSTNAGDAALWIKDGEAGYIVEKQNSELLAERVIELLNDDEKRLKFGKNARRIVESPQSYTSEMKKVEDLYMKLIGGKNGR